MARFTARKIHKQIYPATYNFKDDADGDNPTGWTVDEGGGTINVIALLDGHRKVVEMDDTSGADNVTAKQSFSSGQASGTYEYWIRTTDATLQVDMYGLNEGGNEGVYLTILADKFQYRTVGFNDVGLATSDDTWYHIRITFDCATDTYDIYIDGTKYQTGVAFRNVSTTIDALWIVTVNAASGYTVYVDAVGYSWDASYNIGDNIDWRHLKESTDSFEGDDWGTQGTSITWVDSVDTAASVELVPEFNAHKKVLRQDFTSGAGGNDISYHTFASQAKTGWYEFWIKVNDVTAQHMITLNEDATQIILFRISASEFQVFVAAAWRKVTSSPTPVNNTWYHVYIQWYDAATDTFDLWIDNTLYEDGTNCSANQTSGINRAYNHQFNASDFLYLDAPISSLDSDNKADNRTFDYLAYSYDDITSNVAGTCMVSENAYTAATAILSDDTTLTINELHFVILLDENGDLRFEGNIKSINEGSPQTSFPLVSFNNSELIDENSYTASSAEDVNASLLAIHTNVSHIDGRLIYHTEDDPSGNLTPNFRNKPKSMGIRWFAIHGGKVAPIRPNGVFMLDDDRNPENGAVTISSTTGEILGVPLITIIKHQINYVEVRGAIDPDTGTPFSGTSEDTTTQADGTGYIRYFKRFRELQSDTDCANRATQIRTGTGFQATIIEVELRGVYAIPGEIINFAYSPLSFTATNCYVESVVFNLVQGTAMYRLNTGIFDIGAMNTPGYTYADETADDIAETLFDTDVITIYPPIYGLSGATEVDGTVLLNAVSEQIMFSWHTAGKIDISRSATITWAWRGISTPGDTIAMLLTITAFEMDGDGGSDIVEAATAFTLPACTDGNYQHVHYTIAASDMFIDRLYDINLIMNEANRDLAFRVASVSYFQKRSVP